MTYRFYLFRIILQRIYYRNHVILLLETLYPPASFATFTPNLHSQLTVCSLYVSYLTLEGQDTLAAASSYTLMHSLQEYSYRAASNHLGAPAPGCPCTCAQPRADPCARGCSLTSYTPCHRATLATTG